MIVTDTQRAVLQSLARCGTLTHPRRSLQRLHKKGLVSGSRRAGFRLTARGLRLAAVPDGVGFSEDSARALDPHL